MSYSRSTLISCFAGLLLVVVVGSPIATSASDRFQPVSAEELAMKSEPLAPGAPAIILFRQVDRDDNRTASTPAHEDNYVRIKILTQEGLKYADVAIPFSKDSEDVVNLKARTIEPDGSIVNFDGKILEKSFYQAGGMKYLAKTLTLPEVRVGGIIEYYYSYAYRENNLYESHWILSEELFTKSAKFLLRTYNPLNDKVTVSWSWQLLPAGTSPPHKDPDHIIRLEAHNVPAFHKEDFMPPENEVISRVDFAYSYDPPEPDNSKFWIQVGKKRNAELERFLGKRDVMQQAVRQMISPGDSPEVKLRKIYVRVQRLHNTSYEAGANQQDDRAGKSKETNNVENVWERGYGNDTELTWLYLALVRAAGFDAHGVWVSDRMNYFFDPAQREPYKLDANAVLIKFQGKDIFCAPGVKFAPFGLLPWSETGVQGLELDKDGGTWIKTPLPPSSASRIERRADLELSNAGDLQGKLTLTFTGLEAMYRRTDERNENEAGRRKYLEDQVKRYVPASTEVELINPPDWDNPSLPLVAEFHLRISAWASMAGRRVSIPVGLFSGPEQHLFDHAERVYPVYVAFPSQKIDEISLRIPPGWQVSGLPPGMKQDGHVITYSIKAENDKGIVRLTRTLDTNFLVLQTQYYTALRNFYQQVQTGDKQQIVLQSGTTTAKK